MINFQEGKKNHKIYLLLEVVDVFIAKLVLILQLYSSLQIQVVYNEYVELLVCQSYFNKVVLKNKNKKMIQRGKHVNI